MRSGGTGDSLRREARTIPPSLIAPWYVSLDKFFGIFTSTSSSLISTTSCAVGFSLVTHSLVAKRFIRNFCHLSHASSFITGSGLDITGEGPCVFFALRSSRLRRGCRGVFETTLRRSIFDNFDINCGTLSKQSYIFSTLWRRFIFFSSWKRSSSSLSQTAL